MADDLQRQIELAAKDMIERLDAEIAAKEAERQRLVAELQCTCSHPEMVEMPYQSSDYGSSTPDARVCTTCGLAEYGWDCGHQVLHLGENEYRIRLRQVTPKEFYRLQRGPIWMNHEFVERGRRPIEILREKLGLC